jgi:environmental stress-induced protein Ves
MRIIHAADYRRMPWKNGGGETTEIAVSPPGAALDGFAWRISMARVASDGPFSLFPGIDRTLMILAGSGIRLAIAGRPPVDLTAFSDPLAFPGDIAAAARLIEGPVVDLNVMTRRGRLTHDVTRLRLDEPIGLAIDADAALLLCHAGSVAVATSDGTARLGALDSLLVEDRPRGPWRIVPEGSSLLVLIEIRNAAQTAATAAR